MPITDALAAQLDRLAAFEPGPFPVVSLYLNAQPDHHGRDHFEPFLRRELPDRINTYPVDGPERESLEQDAEKIRAYTAEMDASANGVVLFSSSGAGLFEGKVDKVFLTYNDFVNTMTQRASFDQLLPLPESDTPVAKHDWDYLYEPDAQAVLEHVLTRYIESLVYQAVLENVASEHAARMVAMKAASDNATKLIGTLNLVYNKARQAAITQEISEIVGGAAAV